jgi:hypothetical protein
MERHKLVYAYCHQGRNTGMRVVLYGVLLLEAMEESITSEID